MAKYRKKPVVIDAIQWKPETMLIKDVFDAFGGLDGMNSRAISRVNHGLIIKTLEGDMVCSPGDYIIKGVKGEVYPCKPDIFEATYEPVDPRDRLLTYKEHLMVADYPQELLDTMSEEDCEAEYIELSATRQ